MSVHALRFDPRPCQACDATDDTRCGCYTSEQACAAAQVSYRQLDYWARTGRLGERAAASPGSGHARRWLPDEVRRVRLLSALVAAGWNLTAAGHIATTVESTRKRVVKLERGIVVGVPDWAVPS